MTERAYNSRAEPSRAERVARTAARGTPRRGVLIHQLRVLAYPTPLHPPRHFVPPPCHSQPQTTPSFRFDPSPPRWLLSGSFSLPSSPSRPPELPAPSYRSIPPRRAWPTPPRHPSPRMSTMPLAAIYPNRANARNPPWLLRKPPTPLLHSAHNSPLFLRPPRLGSPYGHRVGECTARLRGS